MCKAAYAPAGKPGFTLGASLRFPPRIFTTVTRLGTNSWPSESRDIRLYNHFNCFTVNNILMCIEGRTELNR